MLIPKGQAVRVILVTHEYIGLILVIGLLPEIGTMYSAAGVLTTLDAIAEEDRLLMGEWLCPN